MNDFTFAKRNIAVDNEIAVESLRLRFASELHSHKVKHAATRTGNAPLTVQSFAEAMSSIRKLRRPKIIRVFDLQ